MKAVYSYIESKVFEIASERITKASPTYSRKGSRRITCTLYRFYSDPLLALQPQGLRGVMSLCNGYVLHALQALQILQCNVFREKQPEIISDAFNASNAEAVRPAKPLGSRAR